MSKKQIACILAVLLLIFAGCGKQDDADPTTAEVIEATEEATEATVTTEENIPGLEDSEFDDETEPTVDEVQAETEARKPTESTKPEETAKPKESTEPTESTTSSEAAKSDYEEFQNMNASDQQAFMESFDSVDAFFDWYNREKEEYEAANPPIDVGDGTIDMGELTGDNG